MWPHEHLHGSPRPLNASYAQLSGTMHVVIMLKKESCVLLSFEENPCIPQADQEPGGHGGHREGEPRCG